MAVLTRQGLRNLDGPRNGCCAPTICAVHEWRHEGDCDGCCAERFHDHVDTASHEWSCARCGKTAFGYNEPDEVE